MCRAEIHAAFTFGAVLLDDSRLVIDQFQCPRDACINAAAAAETAVFIYAHGHTVSFFKLR